MMNELGGTFLNHSQIINTTANNVIPINTQNTFDEYLLFFGIKSIVKEDSAGDPILFDIFVHSTS